MPDHGAPLVVIAVDHGLAYVNGTHVPGDGDPEAAAVAFVAARFAVPAGRPVRALLTSAEGHRRILVAPDATVIETEAPVSTAVAAPSGHVARRARSAGTPLPVGTFRPPRLDQPALPSSDRRRVPVGVLSAVLVALLGTAALAVVLSRPGEPAHLSRAINAAALAPPPVRRAAVPVHLRVRPAAMLLLKPQQVSGRVTGGVGGIRVIITRLQRPAVATLRLVDSSGGARTTRAAVRAGQTMWLPVAPGSWSWRLRVPGAAALAGRILVTAPASSYQPPLDATVAPIQRTRGKPHRHPYVPAVPIDPDTQ